jgi:hypothetical protein
MLFPSMAVIAAAFALMPLPSGASRALTLPKSFSGSLTDVERQSKVVETSIVNGTTFHETFSAYKVTYKLDDLVFGPGAGLPYTLLKYDITADVIKLTQTAPAGKTPDGCVTHYTFQKSGTPTGNIGSFSEVDGKWETQLDMGIQMGGTTKSATIKSSGCGPTSQSTPDSYFGVPPRIGVSIVATGIYDPSDETLTFSSTDAATLAPSQGHQTHSVDGTLKG